MRTIPYFLAFLLCCVILCAYVLGIAAPLLVGVPVTTDNAPLAATLFVPVLLLLAGMVGALVGMNRAGADA